MQGERRDGLDQCEVGDFVYYSHDEHDIGDFLEVLDDNEHYWLTMPDGEARVYEIEETEDDRGFRVRRIANPSPPQ